MSQRYCLTLDLQDDPELIAEYERYHEKIPDEITASIKASGIEAMEIYRLGTRMFMIIETDDAFSLAAKLEADRANPQVQAWEALMWRFQRPLAGAAPGEKWVVMERIFKLED